MRRLVHSVPDLLSLSRIGLAAAIWLVVDRLWAIGILMAVAAATDLLDGWVARRVKSPLELAVNNRGRWLDPLCDKIFVTSLAAAFFWRLQPPPTVIALILARELAEFPPVVFYLLRPRLRRRVRYDFSAHLAGKLTTLAQFAALATLLLVPQWALLPAALAAALGLVAVGVYVRRGVQALRLTRPTPQV